MLAITLTMQFPLDIFFGINEKFDLLIKCFLYAIFGNQCSLQGNGNRDGWFDWFMVFNATFNNISVISWQSVLFGGGNRSVWRKQRPVPSH